VGGLVEERDHVLQTGCGVVEQAAAAGRDNGVRCRSSGGGGGSSSNQCPKWRLDALLGRAHACGLGS
jgi:hypothetical protein